MVTPEVELPYYIEPTITPKYRITVKPTVTEEPELQ